MADPVRSIGVPSTTKRYEIVGVGNAIVDVIAQADDDFLHRHQLPKGGMTLVSPEEASRLYEALPPAVEVSGGSAANTIAGAASFGSAVAFIGKTRDDQLGSVFRHDMRAIGVDFDTVAAPVGPPTATCLIIVTPDAQRTMHTSLGISSLLEPADIDPELCASAEVVYCEGYLWDVDSAKQAIRKAMAATKEAGGKVALTLSDGFCVDRHRAEFLELVDHYVDVLFANEVEIRSLYEVEDTDEAIRRVTGHCGIAAITRSAEGSVVVTAEERVVVPAWTNGAVIDTTGAGDQYAAGFLHGMARGATLERCAHLGSLAAGEVISHVGPRPNVSLAELAAGHALV